MIKIDFNSPEWAAIEDWAKHRLTEELSALKSPSSDYGKTQFVRGRIAVLEEMLSLPELKEVPESELFASY
jgi:hypothetical protein